MLLIILPLFGVPRTAIGSIPSTEHGNYSYDHDTGWRLTDVTEPDLSEKNYYYDEIGRRSPASDAIWPYTELGGVLNTGATQYTYDDDGNRTTSTTGGVTTHYFHDESDRQARDRNDQVFEFLDSLQTVFIVVYLQYFTV